MRMKGEQVDIERIVATYSEFLLRLVMHDTHSRSNAEDIVQETFIRYLKHAPQDMDEQHEKAWLIRVASNQVKDIHRSWWNRKTTQLQEDQAIVQFESQTNTTLLEYIRKLSKGSRHAIYLFYYEGYSISEIASIYEVSENTVASWLHRGRKQLKEMMEGVDFDELG